jgi:large subunit ribosomal protein L10
MSKRRLMKIAIEECKDAKKGVEELNKYLKGMPALIFTNENPFRLYKMLSKSKTNAPAKPGQVAPKDILIQAGPTPFAPGPVISELSMIGLKTGVEGGKVAIKQDKVVVREGEKINDKVASILLRLGITPMEVGLNLVAAYENGTIFTKDVLAVDEKEFMQRIIRADSEAFNLAVEIEYPCTRVLEYLIGKAFNESKALALSQNIICSLVTENVLSKAEKEMLILKEATNIKIEKEVKEEDKLSKVEELVKKTKEFVERKKIKAQDLIEEAKKADESKEIAEEIVRKLQRGEQIKKEKRDIPSIAELAAKRKKE